MQKILIYLAAIGLLAGCAHKIPVRQGNIVTQEQLAQLKPGMDQHQVQFVLGTPQLVDPFHADRWDYFYSLSPSGAAEPDRQYDVSVFFEAGKMVRYRVNGQPPEKPPLMKSKFD